MILATVEKMASSLFRCSKGLLMVGLMVQGVGAESVRHFVAPAYPPLARQAEVAGHVVLEVSIAKDGKVQRVEEAQISHPLLAGYAKRAVLEWRFDSTGTERRTTVRVNYGLSGAPRETNWQTTFTADFYDNSTRIYVIAEPPVVVHP